MHLTRTVREAPSRRVAGLLATVFAAIGIAFAGDARAALFMVDSVLDEVDDNISDSACHTASGTCTLRAAIMEANRVVGESAAIMVPSGTYQLTIPPVVANDGDTNGDLALLAPVSGNPTIFILGAGASTTIIDAGSVGRVLRINGGRTAVIANVTLRNGKTFDPEYGQGGGLSNFGTVTVDHCMFTNNQALGLIAVGPGIGGAIFNWGTLTILSTSLEGNMSTGEGGGIYNGAGAIAEIRQSTLAENAAQTTGGGITNYGTLSVVNSTISANRAGTQSGGIDNLGTGDIYNSTIAFNQSNVNGSFAADGSGVFNAGTLNLRNSVLAGNFRALPVLVHEDCGGDLDVFGNNRFFAIPSGCTVTQHGAGTKSAVTALDELGPLRGNGGPTRTHALKSSSAMIDGSDATDGCIDQGGTLTVDQRGRPRSLGASCDIGAYEYDADEVFQNGFD